jgi:hypothetical protein
MPDENLDATPAPPVPDDGDDRGGIGPYVAILLTALVLGGGLALYIAGYRDEIVAILTQSPT